MYMSVLHAWIDVQHVCVWCLRSQKKASDSVVQMVMCYHMDSGY